MAHFIVTYMYWSRELSFAASCFLLNPPLRPHLVLLSCSSSESTWNLTCSATEWRLMPTWPAAVKPRRTEDARRSIVLWPGSRPAIEPEMDVASGPRAEQNRSLIALLEEEEMEEVISID